MKPLHLPKSKGCFDFVIIGSKAGFFAMIDAVAVAAAAAIFC